MVSYQVYFFVPPPSLITSFAQQQPQVDNEMHMVDLKESNEALMCGMSTHDTITVFLLLFLFI